MQNQLTGKPEPIYHAYLLKIWQENVPGSPAEKSWRFSLEDAHAGTRRGFHDLDSLLVYLHDITGSGRHRADERLG